jgi:hypothetical protein
LTDHHHHGLRQGTAGADEEFEAIVEHRGIAAVRLDNRLDLLDILAEQRGDELLFARMHPVDIAAQRVDFAVMAQETIRMRAIPARKRIG